MKVRTLFLFIFIFIILLSSVASAGVVSDVSDFFTNTFTSKQVINENDVRIGGQKKIIFDGSSGYLPIEIENLGNKDKDLEIGLIFQDDLCEVKWYEAYEYVNEPIKHYDCYEDDIVYENNSIEDRITCDVTEEDNYIYKWKKYNIKEKKDGSYKSKAFKKLGKKSHEFRAYVECVPGSSGKYDIETYEGEIKTVLDPEWETYGNWAGVGVYSNTEASGLYLNLTAGQTKGNLTRNPFGDAANRYNWQDVKVEKTEPSSTLAIWGNDLIAYYSQDDDDVSGTTIDDLKDGTFDGTADATVTCGLTGKLNEVCGTSNGDKIDLTDGQIFNGTAFSISAWVQLNSTFAAPARGPIVYFEPASSNGLFSLDANRKVSVKINGGCTTTGATAVPNDESWNHVVMTYDGSWVNVWLNGAVDSNPTACAVTVTDSGGTAIGGNCGGACDKLNSPIDEIGIWTRNLTAAEITSLYNSGNGLSYLGGGASSEVEVSVCYSEDNITFGSCDYNVTDGQSLTNSTSMYANYIIDIFRADTTVSPAALNVTLSYLAITPYPTFTFISQNPNDLLTDNLFDKSLNITYQITDLDGVDDSTVVLQYKTNSSTDPISYYENGTEVIGFQNRSYASKNGEEYSFLLGDNEVYPGTYPINETLMRETLHSSQALTTTNRWLKTKLYNVSNSKQFGELEMMVNSTGTNALSEIWMCNNTYVSGTITTNPNCGELFLLNASQPFNHSHPSNGNIYSFHHVIPFAVDTTTGTIGNVYVTDVMHFLIRGNSNPNQIDVWYIPEIARPDTTQLSLTGGISWSDVSGTTDIHLHQFDNDNTFYYKAYACDTVGMCNESTTREDQINLTDLPPTPPFIIAPSEQSYTGNITILYTAALSPIGTTIDNYTIELYDGDFVYDRLIVENEQNLEYVWDMILINLADGEYRIGVKATDENNLFSTGFSQNFTTSNPLPTDPDILTPNNNTNFTTSPVTLECVNSTVTYTPVSYEYQLSLTDDFTTYNAFNSTSSQDITYTPENNTEQYWRCRAFDTYNRNSSYSETRYYVFDNRDDTEFELIYGGEVYSSSTNDFKLNLMVNPYLVKDASAIFEYNNSQYTVTKTKTNDSSYTFQATTTAPFVSVATSKAFEFNVTMSYFNSTNIIQNYTENQLINPITITLCNETNLTADKALVLNYTFGDESDYLNRDNFTADIELNFEYWVDDPSVSITNYYNLQDTTTLGICVEPANLTIYANTETRYEQTGYDVRWHYFRNQALSSSTLAQALYLLNISLGTQTYIWAVNEVETPFAGYYVEVERFYPGDSEEYVLVAMGKTDDLGYSVMFTRWDDVQHRVRLYNYDEQVYTSTSNVIFSNGIGDSTDPYKTVLTQGDIGESYASLSQTVNTLVYNPSSSAFIFSYEDLDTGFGTGIGSVSQFNFVCLDVWQRTTGYTGRVYQNCSTNFTDGSLSVNIGSTPGDYNAQAFITYLTNKGYETKYLFATQTQTIEDVIKSSFSDKVGKDGSIYIYLLAGTLAVGFAAVGGLIAGIFGLFLGVIAGVFMGVINYTYTALIVLGTILGIILWLMRNR